MDNKNNGTYDYDTEFDVIPKCFDIVQSKVLDFEYFFHRKVNNEHNDDNVHDF